MSRRLGRRHFLQTASLAGFGIWAHGGGSARGQQGRSPMIAKWLSEGLQHHQAGRLTQAEAFELARLMPEPAAS